MTVVILNNKWAIMDAFGDVCASVSVLYFNEAEAKALADVLQAKEDAWRAAQEKRDAEMDAMFEFALENSSARREVDDE